MLQISVDVTVLSQSQREAFADFILAFPNSSDDPVRPCPKMEVDRSLWTKEEQEEEGSTLFSVTFPFTEDHRSAQ